MTRHAAVRLLYAAEVERQPFSRFTADPAEQAANDAWRQRAQAWGDAHVDAYGNRIDGEAVKPKPADPDLFRCTAPQWNCVDFPGDGMHYTPIAGGRCVWCGMTRAQITAEREA